MSAEPMISESQARALRAAELGLPTWTGDLRSDCTAAWAGLLLRVTRIALRNWRWVVSDPLTGQEIDSSLRHSDPVTGGTPARRDAVLAAQAHLGLPLGFPRENTRPDFPLLEAGQLAMIREDFVRSSDAYPHPRWNDGSAEEWKIFTSLSAALALAKAEVAAHPVVGCRVYASTRLPVASVYHENDLARLGDTEAGNCPECARAIAEAIVWDKERVMRDEEWFSGIAQRWGLTRGIPSDPAEKASFDQAFQRLRTYWRTSYGDDFPTTFDQSRVLAAGHWWYIPMGWIGCLGYTVSREDGHVNVFGSSNGLDNSIWAQNHGFGSEGTDLVVQEVHDMDATLAVVRSFPHPDSSKEKVRHYTQGEAARALSSLPAVFLSHQLWFGLRLIRHAAEAGAFTFSARPSQVSLSGDHEAGPSLRWQDEPAA